MAFFVIGKKMCHIDIPKPRLMKRFFLLSTLFMLTLSAATASETIWFDGKNPVTYCLTGRHETVVETAAGMFAADMLAVTGLTACPAPQAKAVIRVCQTDKASAAALRQLKAEGVDIDALKELTDGFSISVADGHINVAGTNGRGCAYGLLELSRLAGVSPWIWWGDIVPEKKERLTLSDDFKVLQGASVEYRGIFLNDEDWSLRPWSYGHYEPATFGHIGPKTYRRVFELLLRLRANAIWPAMHTGTQAFFTIEGAKATADSCGIAIGTSHCEPLLRNNVDEWDESLRGRYNYITNGDAVRQYWTERLKEVKGSEGGNMFTIGMRGIHDGSMEGVKTMDEKFTALQQVIDDQQDLIGRYIGDPSKQMQIFVPYKEVLQIYEMGLKVPDWVTLMWCDDNYGYMTRMSDPAERQRAGGAGIYYHLSYWGRPHDYLWLTTTQPGLIYNELRQVYDHDVRKIWIANVHDPKVAGYDLELFLDLAWGIDGFRADALEDHLKTWLCRQFGQAAGEAVFPAMKEFYRLCGERRPEFMGWSQTECDKKTYDRGNTPVRNTEFSPTAFGNELQRYLDRYENICRLTADAKKLIRPELSDAWFAAIEYPVRCASANAVKILESQKARQWASGSTRSDMFAHDADIRRSAAKAQSAYWEISRLTRQYNEEMSGGKWRNIMHMHPRDLPVYGAPVLPVLVEPAQAEALTAAEMPRQLHLQVPTGSDFKAGKGAVYERADDGCEIIPLLGHGMQALSLPEGKSVTYRFEAEQSGQANVTIALIPTQPDDSGDLRFAARIDDGEEHVFSLKEPFRSEQWKLNVLRGQALRSFPAQLPAGEHTLTLRALDDRIVIDQWLVDQAPNRKFYLIPTD